jgi:hypothetical protein
MRRITLIAMCLTIGLWVSGCASLQPILTTAQISDHDLKGKKIKETESCAGYILGIFGPVNQYTSISKTVDQAGFSRVVAMEKKIKNYIVYAENCLVISGY